MPSSGHARLEAVESVLGHRFADRELLCQALTHASAVVDGRRRRRSNERLEFLGDRVLGLIVADLLFEAFPGEPEGVLSRRHDALVRMATLAEVARELELGPMLILARGETESGGQLKANILADACEALIGALYLDGGIEAARGFIRRHWTKRMTALEEAPLDAKTALQEWAQARGLGRPRYEVLATDGPAHAPSFAATVTLDRLGEASGRGRSKRDAEKEAARLLLKKAAPG